MKKSLGLKICASLLAVPIFAAFTHSVSAAEAYYLKIDDLDIYNALTKESNIEETATYDPATGILTLDGYEGKAITTNLAKLTVKVEKDSTITDTVKTLVSSGNLTITGGTLTLSNGLDVAGSLSLESGTLNLGSSDITAKGTVRIGGTINAGSIIVTATSPAVAKILIAEKADVSVSKSIIANYTSSATVKGIELNKVCTNPTTTIINVEGTGSVKTSTVFSANGTTAITGGLKISSANCASTVPTDNSKKTDNTEKNPNTADNIALYAVALVASSAILIYRRHLAKR